MIYFYYYSNNSWHLYLAFGYRGFCGISLTSGLCRGRRVISFLVRCRLSLGRCVHIINCIIDLRSCTRRSLFWSWRLSNWRSGHGFPFWCSSFGYFFRDFWKRKVWLSINEQLSNAFWLGMLCNYLPVAFLKLPWVQALEKEFAVLLMMLIQIS